LHIILGNLAIRLAGSHEKCETHFYENFTLGYLMLEFPSLNFPSPWMMQCHVSMW